MRTFAPPPTKFGPPTAHQTKPGPAQAARPIHAPPPTKFATPGMAQAKTAPPSGRVAQRMTVLFNHKLQEHQTKEAAGIAKRNGDELKLFHLMDDVAPLKKTGLFSVLGFGSTPTPTETLHLIGHGSGSSFAGMTAKQLAIALKGKGMDKARFKDIVLHSCSTGSEVGGIASQLSVEMGMTVNAPTGSLSLDGLTVYGGKSNMELTEEAGMTTFTSDGRGYVPPTKFL